MATTLMDQTKQLLNAVADRRLREQQDRERQVEDARLQYRQLLGRRKSPLPDDARDLAFLMEDLGITPEQVEADCKLLDGYDWRHERVAAKDAAHAAAPPARAAMKAAQRAAEEAEKAWRHARIVAADCDNRGWELRDYLRQRPDLFEAGPDGLPYLKGVHTPKPVAATIDPDNSLDPAATPSEAADVDE